MTDRKTLNRYTPEQRADMVGMWMECDGGLYILQSVNGWLDHPRTQGGKEPLNKITPRLDLHRAWTPTGEPVPGEWEDGYIYLDWDEPDMADGHHLGPTEPVSIEGQATGEMCYYDSVPDGLTVTMIAPDKGQGEARRFITEWEALP